ncbi:MAG: hypothetical protein Barrevirus15_6 [Barrevirus sp.]|uniref:Uncharacterized protein n=1 Tax=Barrevirus sp. TaxID=2487763 RepID=A0A3G4ZQI1_9VIRU|nr:MAG: hypothetical protein Barrevirus15_6 [Barrevirus sp.]
MIQSYETGGWPAKQIYNYYSFILKNNCVNVLLADTRFYNTIKE